ncbi:hypothetical protein [Pseudothermotoga thermarum]|uniref:Glycosyltransferase RgtA/B/C/D-like domain-containing protein n=1 Tax=Pseudothermotoga thermarum DSM 5069 TaxID=688269 RepID=F7YXD1_9THEM|nr:hypothetical protein [Pseudothermotoga thermarum]AEH51665.1 hypothetical protein Theth_1614 [Pseudothermotoga thermarum DSM 5069]
MLIIFAEILILFFFLKKQRFIHRNLLLFISLLLQAVILTLYRVELTSIWNRQVYWSDAEYYWNGILQLLDGNMGGFNNFGYILYGALIQMTSPFKSVFWNNLSNLLILDLSFVIGLEILRDEFLGKKVPTYVYLTTILNPLVIYSLLRNLKDVLFLFLTILSVYIYFIYFKRRRSLPSQVVFFTLYLIFFITSLVSVRPWGFIIPFLVLFVHFFRLISVQRLGMKLALVVLLLILIYVFISLYLKNIIIWLEARENLLEKGYSEYKKLGVLGYFLGVFRLILGPGPIRSMFGSQRYFQFYTYIGNVCSSIGSLLWYFTLPIYVINLKSIPKITGRFPSRIFSLLILALFVVIYVYFYYGSTELRFRGVIYVLTSISLLIPSERVINSNFKSSNLISVYALTLLFLTIPAIFLSI